MNNKVYTAKTNSINTANEKDLSSAVGKHGVNAVKVFNIDGCGDLRAKAQGNYQDHDGGFVAFTGSSKGGRITGKGRIKTTHLDFKDVYFVKELKFNLFSVSQMCDKHNSVLFTETECLILSPDFKLRDENQVMLKIPRKDNMYSFGLKNIVPSKGLTCLIAKATNDESNMWHRRLGHINFKIMNKLVKGNLVRELPSKLFENDHTCVACQKGKQHKASCKTKLVNSISTPLQILHMDLFRPTFVKSIMGKMYCLVITDDYSRFSWVFFLAKKDETSSILKNFITGIENHLNHKVKVIRCDNGTEFKNFEMNQFCGIKGIKREFSNARTPQQNGVAERKNRTLIEAAKTMVLVTKPHNKTPYEFLIGRSPIVSFMRPFGCLVTILNILDHLAKFDGKADEGFLVGYSINSKAVRVYNSRTRKVEENLHVNFLENKPSATGNGPKWLFDIDSLTNTMNYQPVNAGNRTNGNAGLETTSDAGQDGKDSEEDESSPKADTGKKNGGETPAKESEMHNSGADIHADSTNRLNTISSTLNIVSTSFSSKDHARLKDQRSDYERWLEQDKEINADSIDPLILDLEDTLNSQDAGIFGNAYNDEDVGAEADMNNLETTIDVSPIPTTIIAKDHPTNKFLEKWTLQSRQEGCTSKLKLD
ncbi:putative ribonuclease H-like domain-containing protein [Tanacetum coccineum]